MRIDNGSNPAAMRSGFIYLWMVFSISASRTIEIRLASNGDREEMNVIMIKEIARIANRLIGCLKFVVPMNYSKLKLFLLIEMIKLVLTRSFVKSWVIR